MSHNNGNNNNQLISGQNVRISSFTFPNGGAFLFNAKYIII